MCDDAGPGLEDAEGSEDNPVGKKLGIVGLSRGLQSDKREITRDDNRSGVGKKLANASNVEIDQKQVHGSNTDNHVGLGHTGLSLKLVQLWELVQLSVQTTLVGLNEIHANQ